MDAFLYLTLHDMSVKLVFFVANRMRSHQLNETGDFGLLNSGLDLGEVEAVFASAFFFDHHEVEEVEDGLDSSEVGLDETVQEDGEYVFRAGGGFEPENYMKEVGDGDDGLLDAADDQVHRAALVDAAQFRDHVLQVVAHVLHAPVRVVLLRQVVQRYETQRPATQKEAKVLHRRRLWHDVQKNPA
jgi:hypothetical protein